MLSKINKIAVIGTGVIGTGWIIRMLVHNKKITAFDLNIKQKIILIKEIKRSLPFVKKLFKKKKINLENLTFKTSLIETLKDADFIQECVSENYKLKKKINVRNWKLF
jgi:carnitine 3-dehydrogenase